MNDVAEFLEHLKLDLDYSDFTINSYKQDLKSLYKFLGSQDFDLKKVDLKLVRNYLSCELENGISKRTLCRRLSTFRNYFNFLVRNKKLKINVFLFIDGPKKEIVYPEALYIEQIENEYVRKESFDFDFQGIRAIQLMSVMKDLNILEVISNV